MKKPFIILSLFVSFFCVPSNAMVNKNLTGVSGGYGKSDTYTAFSNIGEMLAPEVSANEKYIHYAGFWNPYVFNPFSKAIIVAGSGPSEKEKNPLWNATSLCCNMAYKTLLAQGYQKSDICYLSADRDAVGFDIDGNNLADDISGFASSENLITAITEWASDADNLLIYMTGHGGDKNFRINQTQIFKASQLKDSLDQVQQYIPAYVVLLYDACQSGSFIPVVAGVKNRIIFTSTDSVQNSVFIQDGAIAFSSIFWGRFLSGLSAYDSYVAASQALMEIGEKQTAQCEANGNLKSNEKNDYIMAMNLEIGDNKAFATDIPRIGVISQAQIIYSDFSSVYAKEIASADDIKQVWAVITPPDFRQSGTIMDLPVVTLELSQATGRYEGYYDNFKKAGIYYISFFAINEKAMISLPVTTTIEKRFIAPDTDNDGFITISDVIAALQLLTDEKQPANVVTMKDVLTMFDILKN